MTTLSISARPRHERGRHVHALRRRGTVPAVVYGHEQPATAIEADAKTLERLWHRAGKTALVDLSVDGQEPRKVLIRELQVHPRSGRLLHADFFAVNLRSKIHADVPVHLTGESPAATRRLGQLLQTLTTLKVECLPADIPGQLPLDVGTLEELDAALTAGDVPLPSGVTLLTDPGDVVVKVVALRIREVEEEEAAEAEAAAEAAGEIAAAEAAGGEESSTG